MKDDAERIKKLEQLVIDLYLCDGPEDCHFCKYRNENHNEYYCKLGIGWRSRRLRELGLWSRVQRELDLSEEMNDGMDS